MIRTGLFAAVALLAVAAVPSTRAGMQMNGVTSHRTDFAVTVPTISSIVPPAGVVLSTR